MFTNLPSGGVAEYSRHMNAGEREEMTAAAIARHAGVGRAAVSNWRRRYPEFPKPVGGSPTSPTFSLADVEAWLKATGKADQLATAGRTETGTQRITEPTGSPDDLFDESVRGVQPEIPERAVADLTSGQLLARVMVSLLPRSIAEAPVDDDAEAPVVIDPPCLHATLLLAVADRFGDRVRLAAQEIQESAASVAALNLRGHAH